MRPTSVDNGYRDVDGAGAEAVGCVSRAGAGQEGTRTATSPSGPAVSRKLSTALAPRPRASERRPRGAGRGVGVSPAMLPGACVFGFRGARSAGTPRGRYGGCTTALALTLGGHRPDVVPRRTIRGPLRLRWVAHGSALRLANYTYTGRR
jgi:hypothetical protein